MFTTSSSQAVEKINIVDDERVQRREVTINGKTYGYLLAEPKGGFSRTVLLIHGFPDLAVTWKSVIPLLLKFGFRDAPTDSLTPYTYKSQADDFVELAKQLGSENLIVGGHDWGAVIAYRVALWHPTFVTHLFTFAIPYIPPSPKWLETSEMLKMFPSLGYQLQFGSDEGIIESSAKDKAGIRAFLNTLYGGTTSDGKYAIDVTKGVDLELATQLNHTRLLAPEELDYYVEVYARNGLRGPCNYYRTRQANFNDEQVFAENPSAIVLKCPTLFVRASTDAVVSDQMVGMMEKTVPNLTMKEVQAGHWVPWQKPAEVNEILTEWMRQQGLVARDS
ncbi:alpha/beta fold hydrolase [Aspergillus affinis]|uniref:alpha/beta fold hydrolase n=1 Tax=Aspergillus affinis TaxID=1070780 RepID=UPI0022FDF907|nr:alpha/beta hydrolase [Aspergillus affinis]KAI9036630.1 alpha/beta hydrolase [Aspergillus affinis]